METAATAPDVHHNPFEVLELGANATARDITRQKDKLLGMLELGLDRAKRYASSAGDKERTSDLVRTAAQELERPRSRLTWELWLRPSDQAVDGDPDAAAMRTALVLHHELLREVAHGIAFGVDELDEIGAAWDQVLASDGLFDRVAARASELGLDDDDAVLEELREEIRTQMLTMLERGPVVDLDALSSEIASDVAHVFADRKVEILELATSRLVSSNARAVQRQQQWHGLAREYAATVHGRGDYLRRAAFQAVHPGISDFAVDLFNNDKDHSLALSMFTWLRDEATNLGDDDMIETHGNNVRIVQERIRRDTAALYAGTQDLRSRNSEWGAGRLLWIAVAVLLAFLRLGRGCETHTSSYEYDRPPQIDPEMLERIRQYEYRQPGLGN